MSSRLHVPASLVHLADCVDRFLATPTPGIQRAVNEVIKPLGQIGEVSIIGGLVRDLAFYGPDDRPISDIDLVVTGSPSMVAAFANRVGARPNRFGGFGLTTEAYKLDFWSLSSTWARRQGHVSMAQAKDLVKCTFFDWDAVVYSTKTRKVHAINGYLERLHRRVLDLNLIPNPSVRGNLVRALRRLMMWDVKLGPHLRTFINSALPEHNWGSLVAAEKTAFHTHYLERFSNADEFVTQVLQNPGFSGAGRNDRRQQTFGIFGDLRHHYAFKEIPSNLTITSVPSRVRKSQSHRHQRDLFETLLPRTKA